MRLSNYFVKTLKENPSDETSKSSRYLVRGGFIRKEVAGAYTYLPFGLKVLEKIKTIVREEMDKAGLNEVLMPWLGNKESRLKTGRWDTVDVLFHLKWWENREYALNATHEEAVTPLLKEFIHSYKDLDVAVYQIQDKYRNETRAKSGLLRGREFWMKDAYSFHASQESFDKYYEKMKGVYMNVYNRLWLWKDTVIAIADGWDFTERFCHEFQTFLEIGEDVVVMDNHGYSANLEIAEWIADDKNMDEKEEKMEYVDAPNILTIEDMKNFFSAQDWQMLKTVVFKTNSWKFFGISCRGDLQVNEIKVRKFIAEKYGEGFEQATDEDLISLGTARGFVSPITQDKYENIVFFWDPSLKTVKNFIWWWKKKDLDIKNINLNDMCIEERSDFVEPIEWFLSLESKEKLQFRKASEVGNIFPLETKFSKAFDMTYINNKGKKEEIIMWCYGIGISRLMWVMAEYFSDDKWLYWPEQVAPAKYIIIGIRDEWEAKAEEIYKYLQDKWETVILDDRDAGPGFRMKDADLVWIPYQIVVWPKTLANGENVVEFIDRKTGASRFGDYMEVIK